MNKQQVIKKLRAAKPVLAERYGVMRLALFGSTARGEARPDSDVDVVVGFDGPATSARYFTRQGSLVRTQPRPPIKSIA